MLFAGFADLHVVLRRVFFGLVFDRFDVFFACVVVAEASAVRVASVIAAQVRILSFVSHDVLLL